MLIELSKALQVRSGNEPVALIIGDSDSVHVANVAQTLDMYDWHHALFDSSLTYKQAVYTSMHVLLRNVSLVIVVLTDAPKTSVAIDTGYILGVASTPTYSCPVLVYNAMHVDDWPFILHTVDATIERIEDVAQLMDILHMKRGIVDFTARLNVALSILKSTR